MTGTSIRFRFLLVACSLLAATGEAVAAVGLHCQSQPALNEAPTLEVQSSEQLTATPGPGELSPLPSDDTRAGDAGATVETGGEGRYSQALASVAAESDKIRVMAEDLRARLQSMNERVLSLGLNAGNRILLEENRRLLPPVAASEARIQWAQQEIRQLNLELLKLGPLASREPDKGPHGVSAQRNQVESDAQRELSHLHAYSLALGNLAAEHHSLIDQVAAMKQFLDRQLIWVANADPVSLVDVDRGLEGARQIVLPGQWVDLGSRIASRLRSHFWQLVVVLGLVVGVGFATSRLEKAIAANRTSTSQPSSPETEPPVNTAA